MNGGGRKRKTRDARRNMLMEKVDESSREVLIVMMNELVNRAKPEQLQYIQSSLLNAQHHHRSPRTFIHVSDEVLTVALFQFLGLSDHCRVAQTCHRCFILSGFAPPPKFFVNPSAWNKPVKVPSDLTSALLVKMCRFVRTPSLTMWSSRVTDAGFFHLQELPLHTLSLQFCDINDIGMGNLRQLRLHTLHLHACLNITDAGWIALKNMPLQNLGIRRCMISDVGLAHLQQLPLQTLDLSFCKLVTDAGLVHLQQMPLQTLDLIDIENITDVGWAHLQKLPKLKWLFACGCGMSDVSAALLERGGICVCG